MNYTQANYIFARAHDNLVQDIIRDIVKRSVKSDGIPTDAELPLKSIMKMKKAEKRYTINVFQLL